MEKKIVVLDAFPLNPGDVTWDPVSNLGNFAAYDDTPPEALPERVKDAAIVLTNKTPITRKDIPALHGCKLVGVLATGVNVVDVDALAEAGIAVCNVPNYAPDDVAQHALAMLLELTRSITLHSESVKDGDWGRKGWCYWIRPPRSLTGLKLGLIGFGSIGQLMGKYGQALGMEVLAWARSRNADPGYPFEYADLDRIFRECDVISLHCPLVPETEKLINAETLAKMKKGAILLNTARGGLVDEAAAAEALASGHLGGLGTDVLSVEPPTPENPLLKAPNTLITPHIAWATHRSRQNIINIMGENIAAFEAGKPINIVAPTSR